MTLIGFMKDFNYYLNTIGEIGYVEQTTNAIIYASGLPGVKPRELVLFENGEVGQVLSVSYNLIEILVFTRDPPKAGEKVVRTNEFLNIPVGPELLGSVIDSLGNSLEDLPIQRKPMLSTRSVTASPTGILTRKTITKQLETGVSIVDLLLPLGYGQKELIIGDRKTGKTNFLFQSVLTQAKLGNICIYAAIGKKKVDIKVLKEFFQKHNILKNIVIVASGSQDPTGLIYLTPYSAMAISEYFRDEGRDVLLILDDLSTHAKFYREISLLGKRFPGRNSYPGDIFYIHAILLERAGNFTTSKGEKAITCLPVVETIQGDLSGYIQTNLMSMTDGHLYFDIDLFAKGRRPPINPFLSVTRVGRQTQSNIKREISREILSFLTLFEKMQNFTHFGAELNETTKISLSVGEAITRFFDQQPSTSIPINVQIVLFCLLWNNAKQSGSPNNEPDLAWIIKVYEANKDIRKMIDTMVQKATSFNELLGTVKQKGDELLTSINKSKYDN